MTTSLPPLPSPNTHIINTTTPLAGWSHTHTQALLSSLLPLELLETTSAAASSEDPLARNWLPKLLHWFHRTFALSSQPVQPTAATTQQQQGQQQQRQGRQHSSNARFLEDFLGLPGNVSVQEQLLACVEARRGSAVQLSVLLVALLRGVGFLTRSVW